MQVQQAREQSSGAEVSSLRLRLEQAESSAEALRARASENDVLRAKLTDLEASAQHAWQWQEAYSQLQRQLHDVQVAQPVLACTYAMLVAYRGLMNGSSLSPPFKSSTSFRCKAAAEHAAQQAGRRSAVRMLELSCTTPSCWLGMQMELDSSRHQGSDSHAKTPRSSSSMRAQQPSPLTNKKNEDAYDVEAALLSGGGKGFVPLAGVLKRQRIPFGSKPIVWLAHQVSSCKAPACLAKCLLAFCR